MSGNSARIRRSDAIAAVIATSGSVRLRDLARDMNVSEMTLRRDAQCADSGFACLGGYVVAATAGAVGSYDYDRATRRRVGAKRAAARQLLPLLEPGMRVFVDCGSTTLHLASLLTAQMGVTVVTHSLPIADLLMRRGDVAVDLLGGRLCPQTRSTNAESFPGLPDGISAAVITASGAGQGLARCAFPHEMAVKRAAIAAAGRALLLIDTAKRERTDGHSFAPLERFDAIVTEAGIEQASSRAPASSG